MGVHGCVSCVSTQSNFLLEILSVKCRHRETPEMSRQFYRFQLVSPMSQSNLEAIVCVCEQNCNVSEKPVSDFCRNLQIGGYILEQQQR